MGFFFGLKESLMKHGTKPIENNGLEIVLKKKEINAVVFKCLCA